MVGLRDPNIVQVLGVCLREDPIAVVIEYSELGDLHQFLQTSAPDQLTSVIGSSFRTLRSASTTSIMAKSIAYLKLLKCAGLLRVHCNLLSR